MTTWKFTIEGEYEVDDVKYMYIIYEALQKIKSDTGIDFKIVQEYDFSGGL